MKPNFALSLSFDGISLLHRRFPGWVLVDEVSLDTDDLNAALAALHDTATALDPSGLRTKLVIPNDQIKYLSVPAGATEAERDTVREALDGATPYAVDELAFDWARDGDTLHIAAVAHETLAEAEAFALDHAFAPVSFVATPEKGAFAGEPFFGVTDCARAQLPEGAEVERDSAPIRVIGVSKPAQDKDSAAPVVPPEAVPDAAEPPEAAPGKTAPPAPPEEPDRAAPPEDAGADDAIGEPVQAREESTEASETPDVPEKDEPVDAPNVTDEPAKPRSAPPEGVAKPDDAPSADVPEKDEPNDAPNVADEPLAAPAKTAPPPTPSPKPGKPDAPQPFTSIRASRDDVPGATPKLSAPSRLSGLKSPARDDGLRPGAAKDDPPLRSAATLPSPGAEIPLDSAQMAAAAASLRPDPELRLDADAAAQAEAEAEKIEPEKPRATFFSGRKPRHDGTDTPPPRRGADARRKTDRPAKTSFEDEKQRMTIFGARHQEVGGKPRFLGLILTAVLLLFLVGVAAWASIFLDDGLARLWRGVNDVEVAEVPPAIKEQAAAPATPEPEAVDDAEIAAPDPQPEPAAPMDGADATDRADDATNPPPPKAEELTPDVALTRYAATGIWQMAPDAPAPPRSADDADRLFDVSLDPDVEIGTPDTLPAARPAPTETPLPEPGESPPAGVTYDFDENGLVRATPEGAETPSGVMVYAAPPSLAPPADMQRVDDPASAEPSAETPPPAEESAVETSAAEPAADADADTDVAVMGDPASPLADIRPRPRPADLAPQTTETETGDDAALDPETAGGTSVTDEETAVAAAPLQQPGIRPRARPADASGAEAQEQAAEIDPEALEDAVALATQQTGQLDQPDPALFEDATPQAVSASLTPNQRPTNFAAIVKRTQDSMAAEPVAAAQVLAPSIPSSTSVAREATTRNAIKLRDVNLIGVYGSSKSRRALVRLPNGRYKKVKVGDALDGGKVAAIGDSELRYIKRGRNVTLRIPKG
ncbi:hypothetical protein D6850_08245 [Roseovarius spongiae]|uniref:Translation initiation factor 2 n=1 Tax=Roseovarius spongiae TaxID=2320272 RepID=A0A3A8AXM0_9RHOB|nr:hypothetical protein [Roseovarius spongiae]RKF14851.1 hypothetical protein D6850_08245 [Roseovarius spongiae]